MSAEHLKTGLILSGGGARGSYQVGVLKAIAHLMPDGGRNPFDIICGTSAGAINASLLACECDHYGHAITRLEELWSNLDSHHIHKVGFWELFKSTTKIFRSFFHSGIVEGEPSALLDNSPLRHLLGKEIDFSKLSLRLEQGDLTALSITALAYSSGQNVSFFQGADDAEPWRRNQRIGFRTVLNLDHLMASSALPVIFPPVRIHNEYFGDGAIRQNAPLSTALHLGAGKLFVIGLSHNARESRAAHEIEKHTPTLAQIAGHLLNSSFIDAMDEDLEMLERFNLISRYLSSDQINAVNLKPVEVMTIMPSVRFDEIAARHIASLPRSMRTFFRTIGATATGGGASLASYLLFEAGFCNELIEAGYNDTIERQEEIVRFLSD
ncbi:MAG: patatin-like phospholipase family protein [Pseudomonadales bacterium]|nr:patatin-like phospholipase family protein [Pseudomonadales bacterium]